MKKNYISDLRYSQKIKQSQSFKQADGLQKKVRKQFQISPQSIFDAQKQLRHIMCFWKQGWQYQHCHSVFLNPKVYYPIVAISDPQDQTHQQLKKYAQMIYNLIQRLRIDQQNQVNYKIQPRKYIHNWSLIDPLDQKYKYHKVAQLTTTHLLKTLNLTTKSMLQSVQNSLEEIQRVDYCLDSDQIHKVGQMQKELMFVNRIIDRHVCVSTNENQMEEQNHEQFQKQTLNINSFVANVISVLDQMKHQNHGPSFFSVQPQIGQLTYILHPILWSIMALFQKQKIQIEKINKFRRQFQQSIPYKDNQSKDLNQLDEIERTQMLKQAQIWKDQQPSNEPYLIEIKDNFKKQNQKYSKILFLNLDGYQSEYNLEVARNFSQNLMYISFPKFSSTNKKQSNAYEQRFYNKIMFEKTKQGETSSQNQQLNFLLKQQRFMKSPQEYHENIEKLYKENHSQLNHKEYRNTIDRNENMYILPIRMNCLFDKHQQQLPQSYHPKNSKASQQQQDTNGNLMQSQQAQNLVQVAQHYQSHFIRFMMRRYLYSQITKFKPTHVIISTSNRIVLQDSHFVELVQELTNVGRYKVMLFANFTTSYIDQIKLEVKEEEMEDEEEKNEDEEISNCYAFTNSRLLLNQRESFIDASLTTKEFDQCPLTLSFFSKLMRFLKITSGTYNLQQSFENQTLSSKLKNVKIFPYAEFLFNILAEQYPQLQNKIDKQILKSDKVFLQGRLEEEKEDLRKCVPRFYRDLFKILETLVIHGVDGDIPLQDNNPNDNENEILPSPYTLDVRRVFEYLIKIGDKEGIKRVRNYQMESIRKAFNEFIQSEEKERMDCRYQEKNHLYFKIRSQNDQYKRLINQTALNLKSNNAGMRIVTFKIGKQRVLHIYKDTSIVFQTNQINKPQTFILVMNHLDLDSQQVCHYIGKINLTDKPSFSHETCQIQQIRFYDGQYQLTRQKFKSLCEWNYTQTSQYLILYWPSEYDFVKASLFKMIKQQYQPRICHDIFLARKNDFTKFYRARVVLDISAVSILPRRGCSAYELEKKIFIFGGVYEREFNYLNLQHDIVTFDIGQLQSLENYQLTLKNQKHRLFSQEYLNNVIKDNSQSIKLNSFIRPKMQIELFEVEDICTAELVTALNQNDSIKTVIMIGGYGENFMFPHSLITYFYHLIKFNKNTKEIISIHKRNTIQKPIPINLKELIKNKHIFQQFHIYQNDTFSQGLTHQDHYFFHRATYNLSLVKSQKKLPNEPDIYDLSFKFLFMYATELFNEMDKNFLKFAQKTGERRIIEETQGTKVEIINGCNNNLFITNQDGTFLYSLNYKTEITSLQTVSLTHEAIISLDVNSNIVCALIKHKQHTKDKCIIASQKISLPNPKFSFQNHNHSINLIKFTELQQNFDLHVLLMMKRNEMIIVHGVSFSQYEVNDKIISTRYTKGENLGEIVSQRSYEVPTPCRSLQTYFQCTSFVARQNQKVLTTNFLSHRSKQHQFIYPCQKHSLDMNSLTKQWKSQFTKEKLLSFYTLLVDGQKQIYLGKVTFIQMRQSTKNKLSNSICVICPGSPLYLSSRLFYFSIDKVDNEQKIMYKDKEVIKVRVNQLTEKENCSRMSWKRIYKNQQRYQDAAIKLKTNQF